DSLRRRVRAHDPVDGSSCAGGIGRTPHARGPGFRAWTMKERTQRHYSSFQHCGLPSHVPADQHCKVGLERDLELAEPAKVRQLQGLELHGAAASAVTAYREPTRA